MTTQHGFFHSIKEKLFQGETHTDADYESARAKYTQLYDSLHKLKSGAHNYASSLYSVFLNSNNTAVEFGSLLEDAQLPNSYQPMCKQLRAAHSSLTGEKQQALTARLQDSVLAPIDQQLLSFQSLQTRIVKRDELHTNLNYYLNKVSSLNKERDERSAKGKTETSSHREKANRNMEKLDTARREYTQYASQLIADLLNVWNQRVAILGPAMAGFVECEKMFIDMYREAMESVPNSAQLADHLPSGIVPAPVGPQDIGVPVPAQALGPNDITAPIPAALQTTPPPALTQTPQQQTQVQTPLQTPTDPHGFSQQSPIMAHGQQPMMQQQSPAYASPIQQTYDGQQQLVQPMSSIDLQQQQYQQPQQQQSIIPTPPPQQGQYGDMSSQQAMAPQQPQPPMAESMGQSAGASTAAGGSHSPIEANPFEKPEGQPSEAPILPIELVEQQQQQYGQQQPSQEQLQQPPQAPQMYGAEGGHGGGGLDQSGAPLVKSEHEDESKRQRFEEEQKSRLVGIE